MPTIQEQKFLKRQNIRYVFKDTKMSVKYMKRCLILLGKCKSKPRWSITYPPERLFLKAGYGNGDVLQWYNTCLACVKP